MNKIKIITIAILFLMILGSIVIYPYLNERIATHWDQNGNVNGSMSKFWGLFFVPIISIFIYLLFLVIPIMDPLKKNIQKFRSIYDWFILIIILFLVYIQILTTLWNLNYKFNMIVALMPAFAVIFYSAGLLISKAQRNWSIGIRTPWTISNETVWKKTHKLGGKLFKISAILILLGLFFPNKYAILFILVPILASSLICVIYSYVIFRKLKK